MSSTENDNMLREALLRFKRAEAELKRPRKDVVAYSVCQSSKQAVEMFLRSYLGKAGCGEMQLKALLERCCRVDNHFRSIDISSFACDGNKCSYCLSVEKIESCFDSLRVVKEFVMAKLEVTEKELTA